MAMEEQIGAQVLRRGRLLQTAHLHRTVPLLGTAHLRRRVPLPRTAHQHAPLLRTDSPRQRQTDNLHHHPPDSQTILEVVP